MSEQHPDIDSIFMSAIEIESPQERAVHLNQACGQDAALRARVEKLLSAHFKAGRFMESPAPGLPTQVPDDAAEGSVIGPYKLLQQIGEGGMGTVFMADQSRPVQRRVALKIIKLGMDTKQVIARFDAERQALAVMDHPNIARVFDAGSTDTGRPYFVMELVKGIPITEYCDKHSLTITQRLNLFAQVCQAVQHAHQKGVIHRDIKPSNILVSQQDDRPLAKVIDFGIAKATQSRLTEKTLFTEFHQLIGTPEYMSPEQAQGTLDIDTRTDVYSLGVLLYELLVGMPPFDARQLRSKAYGEMQRIIREVDPPTPSTRLSTLEALASVAASRATEPRKLSAAIRGELDWIVMKCLAKDRARRYESAAALAADIGRHLADEPVSAGPPSRIYRLRKFVRRHRAAVAAASIIALLLVGGIAGTTIGLLEARKQRDEARRQRLEAERANQNTQAVNEFLTSDLLGSADPAVAQGREITVKEALDNAARTVTETFKNRPLIEASVRTALALTYDKLGHTDLAMPHAQSALEVRRQLLGDDHADTLESLNHVALLLQYQGNFAQAESLYQQVIQKRRATLGAQHPETLGSQFNLGSLLYDLGKFDQAEQMYREVLQGRRRALGEEHHDTLQSLNYLAKVLMDQGSLDEAERLFRETLEKRRRLLGEKHPQTLISISDLGLVLKKRGKLDEAEPLYREANEKYRIVLGEQHPSTLIVMNNLADFLSAGGKLDEAESLFRRVLEGSRKVEGEQHPFTVAVMFNISTLLAKRGRHAEAETWCRDALSRSRIANGEEHPTTLFGLDKLAGILVAQGKLAEAEPLLAELHRKALGAQGDPGSNARFMAQYGFLLLRMGRHAEAEKPLRDSYQRLQETGRSTGPTMRAVLAALAQVCDATNRPDEADALRRQLTAIEAATRPATTRSAI